MITWRVPRMAGWSLVAAALSLAGCGGGSGPAGTDGPQGPPGSTVTSGLELFVASLSGASEMPPVATAGSGTATFTLIENVLLFRLDVQNMVEVKAAHIHGPAPVGVNAPVRVNLYTAAAGTTFSGSGTVAQGAAPAPRAGADFDSVMVLLRNGNAYVNVHTVANPGGELRGQIVP